MSIAVYGGTVLVDEGRITEWGLEAGNGVVHVMDSLLLPALPSDFDPFAAPEAASPGPVLGVTAPLGCWDPLGLWTGKDAATQARLRDAEIKHARLAMLAAIGILTQELVVPTHPYAFQPVLDALRDSTHMAPDVSFLLPLPPIAALAAILAPGVAWEVWSLRRASKDKAPGRPSKEEALTQILKRESPDFEAEREEEREKIDAGNRELNNGRLAMIAVVGMLVQEIVTGRSVLSPWM